MAKLTITNGPVKFEIENGDAGTVGDILELVQEQGLLNVPAGATPLVNGRTVDTDYVPREGDELAFNKAVGQKG